MSVDSELLARQGKNNKNDGQAVDDLRQAKRQSSSGSQDSDESTSLRQAVQQSRTKQAMADKAKQSIAKVTAPARRATGKLLQQAWLNIIPSFGLSIIWINIHVFLGAVFGNNFFCKLGAEWIDENIKQAQFDQAKQLGKVAGNVEGMGLACLDLGCFLILLMILAILAMLTGIFDNPLEVFSTLLGGIWGAISWK